MDIYVEYMQMDIYVECVDGSKQRSTFLTKETELLVFLVVSHLVDL